MITYGSTRSKPLYRATQAVWYVLGVIESLLLIRFLLKLFAANPNAGFTEMIYSLTYPFVAPFIGVFSSPRLEGSVMEWASLLAMLIYWLFAWAVVKLFLMGKPVSTIEAESKLDEQDRQ
jgi:YggT family protein